MPTLCVETRLRWTALRRRGRRARRRWGGQCRGSMVAFGWTRLVLDGGFVEEDHRRLRMWIHLFVTWRQETHGRFKNPRFGDFSSPTSTGVKSHPSSEFVSIVRGFLEFACQSCVRGIWHVLVLAMFWTFEMLKSSTVRSIFTTLTPNMHQKCALCHWVMWLSPVWCDFTLAACPQGVMWLLSMWLNLSAHSLQMTL